MVGAVAEEQPRLDEDFQDEIDDCTRATNSTCLLTYDRALAEDGKPAGYDWVYPHPKPGATTLQYIYAPHVGNEYGRFLAERVALALQRA